MEQMATVNIPQQQPSPNVSPTTQLSPYEKLSGSINYPSYDTAAYAQEINNILSKLDPVNVQQSDLGKNPEFSYEDKFIRANYGNMAERLSGSDLAQARVAARKRRETQDLTDKLRQDKIASQQALSGYFRQANPLRQNPYTAGTQQANAYDQQIILQQNNAINEILASLAGRQQAAIDESAQAVTQIASNPEKRIQEYNNLVAQTQLRRATTDADTKREISLLPAKGAYELALAKARAELEQGLRANSIEGNVNTLQGLTSLLDSARNRLTPTYEESVVIGKKMSGGTLSQAEQDVYDGYSLRVRQEQPLYNSFLESLAPAMERLNQRSAELLR